MLDSKSIIDVAKLTFIVDAFHFFTLNRLTESESSHSNRKKSLLIFVIVHLHIFMFLFALAQQGLNVLDLISLISRDLGDSFP